MHTLLYVLVLVLVQVSLVATFEATAESANANPSPFLQLALCSESRFECSYVVRDLRAYTEYEFSVASRSELGVGRFGPLFSVKTNTAGAPGALHPFGGS